MIQRLLALGLFAMGLLLAFGIWGLSNHEVRSSGPPFRVLARVQSEGRAVPEPQRETKKVKVGTSTRSAVVVGPNDAFEVALPEHVSRLLLSVATQAEGDDFVAGDGATADGDAGVSPVLFEIEALRQGRWSSVFSEVVRYSTRKWTDRVVDLDAASAERLRFVTSTPEDRDVSRVRNALWGSVMLLGRDDAGDAPPSRPNVILVSLDTLSAPHLSAYGNTAVLSPNLDELLSQSHSFSRAYATYGNTLVSHASLFTGLYPRNHGVYEETPELHSNTLAQALSDAGYLTVAVTEDAFVGSDFGFDRGFDWFDNGPGESATDIVPNGKRTLDSARAWLEEFGADTQFFMFLHTYEVHTPYRIRDEEERALVQRLNPGYEGPFAEGLQNDFPIMRHNARRELLPEHEIRQLEALYDAGVNYLDRIFGDFLAAFRSHPAARDTILVVTSDHGEEFGDHGTLGHGHSLHNEVLQVPLAFHWPGKISPGRTETPVQLIDVLPTALDLLEVQLPHAIDGRSLAAAWTPGAGALESRPAYAEMIATPFIVSRDKLEEECLRRGYAKADCRERALSVQREELKLIWSLSGDHVELFDLAADPGEERDLATERAQDTAAMKALLEAYRVAPEPERRTASEPREIDEATRDRLRALGYMH